ncbi:MAG: glutaredoxin [Gammaproteobacteria bacterium]|nr:glutaredoxin [Gammaproteobacteria bacterium]
MGQAQRIKDEPLRVQQAIVELYCTAVCPYCRLTRQFFKDRSVEYLEFHADADKVIWSEMEQRSQRATVPQIFINGYHVGGYEDLIEMDKSRQLDKLLYGA